MSNSFEDLWSAFDPTDQYTPDQSNFNYGNTKNGLNYREGELRDMGQNAQNRLAPDVNYANANDAMKQYGLDRAQQDQYGDQLKSVMEGKAGPSLAEMQMGRGIDASIAAQQAAAHSVSGAGPQAMAAQRQASMNAQQAQMQGVNNTSMLRAQEQQQAREAYGQHLNQMAQQTMGLRQQGIGMDQYGANMAMQQRGMNDQYQLQMEQLRNQAALGQLSARGQMEGYNAQKEQYNAQARGNLLGGAVGAAGAVAMMSDENNKTLINPLMSSVDSPDAASASIAKRGYDDDRADRQRRAQAIGSLNMGFLNGAKPMFEAAAMKSDAHSKAAIQALSAQNAGLISALQAQRDYAPQVPARDLTPATVNGRPVRTEVEFANGASPATVNPSNAPSPAFVNGRPVDTMVQYAGRKPSEMVTSDRRHKTEIDRFLDPLEGFSYEYKDPARDGEGRHYGVMAQDLERSPMGQSMVTETPHGKMVDTRKAAMGALAGLAEHQQEIEELKRASRAGRR